ncbi:MAG TPA: phosphotransferase [Baekduia sp.]|uniref:phosphotransferase n=1 Tax=Baekduia sp. TaxID=2600305 RepID=UPI002C851134|nr:phosphotransferase [Baekduia sp.]HMJ33187.1 phosphotransferase [Baekduia sp.]
MSFADGALHKALVPLGNRAVLTHVIEGFPADARFVVAVGHRADQIRAYLEMAHGDRDITTVRVPNYEGPGSGPGRSLLACAEHLTEPFALSAADAVVSGLPALAGTSWMGVASVDDPTAYMTLDTAADGAVIGFQERTGPSALAFVGVAWIADPVPFFAAIRAATALGELQVTPGFAGLLNAGLPIHVEPCEWLDTGTTATYTQARRRFAEEPSGGRAPTDVTYLLGRRVVKWFRDPLGAERREARGRDLGMAVPSTIPAPAGWLAYERVAGETLRDRLDADEVSRFLDWAQTAVWRAHTGGAAFDDAVRRFYHDKTLARLAAFVGVREGCEPGRGLIINGIATPTVAEALAREIDGLVAAARPTGFHGDLHEGNIITASAGYRLIDWRDDFGGVSDRGDQLYDLAKLLHTLELPESVMSGHAYNLADEDGSWTLAHPDTPERRGARGALWRWCGARGVEVRALGTIDALVFINMAPLYDRTMGDYLYALGRWLLELGHRSGTPSEREARLAHALSGTRARAGRGT